MAAHSPSASPARIRAPRSLPRPVKLAADLVIGALALCVLAAFTYMVFAT